MNGYYRLASLNSGSSAYILSEGLPHSLGYTVRASTRSLFVFAKYLMGVNMYPERITISSRRVPDSRISDLSGGF